MSRFVPHLCEQTLISTLFTTFCSSYLFIQQAEQLYESMIKRFKFDADVWTSFGTFLMKNGRHDQARRLMQRSFKSLIQKDRKIHQAFYFLNTLKQIIFLKFFSQPF